MSGVREPIGGTRILNRRRRVGRLPVFWPRPPFRAVPADGARVSGHRVHDRRPAGPRVGVDGDGNFTLVFESSGQDGAGNGIFGGATTRRAALSVRVPGQHLTTANQFRPAIATNADGDFVVVVDPAAARTGTSPASSASASTPPRSAGRRVPGQHLHDQLSTASRRRDRRLGRFVIVWNSFSGRTARPPASSASATTPRGSPGRRVPGQHAYDELPEFPAVAMDSRATSSSSWTSGSGRQPTASTDSASTPAATRSAESSRSTRRPGTTRSLPTWRCTPPVGLVVAWESQQQDGD